MEKGQLAVQAIFHALKGPEFHPGASQGPRLSVSWGPSNEILDNRFVNIQNSATSTPAGTINGSVDIDGNPAGTFRYRSAHTHGDHHHPTKPTMWHPPARTSAGPLRHGIRAMLPNLQPRIEGRDANSPEGDYILLRSTRTSSSTYNREPRLVGTPPSGGTPQRGP